MARTSKKITQIAKRMINGLEIKYDPQVHIPLLLDLFSEGKDIAAFCYEAEIGRSTFHFWCHEHPAFQRAYIFAREAAHAWWEDIAQQNISGKEFNTTYWSMIMRNRFGYTEHRKIRIDGFKTAKNFKEQHQVLVQLLADGEASAPEANHLASFIMQGAKIDEMTEMKEDVEKLKALLGQKEGIGCL